MSDVIYDFQPDCALCGEQLFDDDLDRAFDNPGDGEWACSRCLWASVHTGQGFED